MRFRAMNAGDLPTVLENEERSYAFPWTRGMFLDCLKSGYQNWVVLLGEAIVGHGIVFVGAGEGHLLNLCVRRDHQGRGMGRQLAEHLLDQAAAGGAEFMFLEVRQSNLPALNLYSSLGFRQIGRRRDYYPSSLGHEDALVMVLDMTGHFAAKSV